MNVGKEEFSRLCWEMNRMITQVESHDVLDDINASGMLEIVWINHRDTRYFDYSFSVILYIMICHKYNLYSNLILISYPINLIYD